MLLSSLILAAAAATDLVTLTSAAPVSFDQTALVLGCDDAPINAAATPGTMIHINPSGISTLYGSQTILLKPTYGSTADDGTGRMCVLNRWTTSLADKDAGLGFYFPLGRSFDGRDWQRPPGKGARQVEYLCGESDVAGDNFVQEEYLCQVTLPMTSKLKGNGNLHEFDAPYYMTYYERTLDVRTELSRFLQRMTFGPTSEELDTLEANYAVLKAAPTTHKAAMEQLQTEWTANQMNPATFSTGKFSSLREYYRRRLSPRGMETYRIGEYGPAPCETDSRWRKFAFTSIDVQNSQYLLWGSKDIYKNQNGTPHKITVETVVIPTTPSPTASPVLDLTGAPTFRQSVAPSISAAPTATSILARGDIEGASTAVLQAWPSGCYKAIISRDINNPADPNYNLVYGGNQSLKLTGGNCYVFRQMGGGCNVGMMTQTVKNGDTLRIAFKVRVAAEGAGNTFQVSTHHYHTSKSQRWGAPIDQSNIVSRTYIENANEWVSVQAIHTVGPDWIFGGNTLTPSYCNHYQLRFQLPWSGADFYLDDVRIEKIDPYPSENVLPGGFLLNPDFELNHKYWESGSKNGNVVYDPFIQRNAMSLRGGESMVQTITSNVMVGETYKFTFWVKLVGMTTTGTNMKISIRLRWKNGDTSDSGMCTSGYCNKYMDPFQQVVKDESGAGHWMKIESDHFPMFYDYSEFAGRIDFIEFTMRPGTVPAGAEVRIANLEFYGESLPPSSSSAPSNSPTTLTKENIGYIVRYAGEIRTVMRIPFRRNDGSFLPMDGSVEYEICEAGEVEGKFDAERPNRLLLKGNNTMGCTLIKGGNPTVDIDPFFVDHSSLHVLDLSGLSSPDVIPINEERTFGGDWLLQTSVNDAVCNTFPSPYDNDYRGADPRNPDALPNRFNPDKPVFAKLPGGNGYALYDPRLILHENTPEQPMMDGGGNAVLRSTIRAYEGYRAKSIGNGRFDLENDENIVQCFNEQPNFLNQDTCKLSYDPNTCVKDNLSFQDVTTAITFDDETLELMHDVTGKYTYAIFNLRFDDTNTDGIVIDLPCLPGNPRSRWVPRTDLDASTCTNTLQVDTVNALRHALETSNDDNLSLRDIVLWNSVEENACNITDEMEYGMLIMTSEGCWENVHPDHMTVFDFTSYVNVHNAPNTTITSFANIGILEYPSNHSMSFYEDVKHTFRWVARYGDAMPVIGFAEKVGGIRSDRDKLVAIADTLSSLMVRRNGNIESNRGGGTLVCGSHGEVASDPELSGDYFDVLHEDPYCKGCLNAYDNYEVQKQTVWTLNSLTAEDQLCQRMAWALYEFLNAGPTSHSNTLTEPHLYQYDVFTRNCFGSYLDALKEMTFSPAFGEQFSFVHSTSTRYTKAAQRRLVFPDENMGREVMQLFTIGLHELELDGTESRDKFGRVMRSYNNLDIMSNSRVFTGFEYTARRGNTEILFRSDESRMDPMRIDIIKHDYFPKSSVDDGWIGDRYPLCTDLPEKPFLKIGAKYRFRGGSSRPIHHYNDISWDHNISIKRFVLDPESPLYQKLCNPDGNGNCNFAMTVDLTENFLCQGAECRVDTVVIVQVTPGAFYEYLRVPCVHLSFFGDGKKVVAGNQKRYTHAMCAHPKTAVAGRMCCGLSQNSDAQYHYRSEYHGELVTAQTNKDKCIADGGTVCDPATYEAHNSKFYHAGFSDILLSNNRFYWTDEPCTHQVKVSGNGMIALLHNPSPKSSVNYDTVPYVDIDKAVTYISVPWRVDPMTFEEIFPSLENNCGGGVCSVIGEECLCEVSVTNTHVFDSLPTREDILSSLHIGAVDPDAYAGAYYLLTSSGDVDVFVSSTSNAIGATSTILKVTNEFNEVAFFKNQLSEVTFGDTYRTRNPVGFFDLVQVEERDAFYEVDAFLKHLVQYRTAAPFISKKLIQFFGTSNPSPSYVQRVTQAFRTGTFNNLGTMYGNGKYGNLAAVAAAITLDPEATTPITDNDPVSGQIREPILKVAQMMRSLSFQRKTNMSLRHGLFEADASGKIGQMPFKPPNQFSFFSSDYMPVGVFANSEMVSPESQLMSIKSVVGITNGFFSFVNYGLAYPDHGFGPWINNIPAAGDYSTGVGVLSYQPTGGDAESKVDELSTMLTAGRLSAENRQVIIDAYNYFDTNHNKGVADRAILQLMLASPEFHTSNTISKSGRARTVSSNAPPGDGSYKAIVYINLFGGLDSFNILTPHSDGGCSLYDDYFQARGGIGLTTNQMLPIDGSSAGIDGCDTFGVNSIMSAYKDIYNEGKGIFIANMGHLHKPVTKRNWFTETRTDLFSHSSMKKESFQVDAFNEMDGTGVLGRMLDVLEVSGYRVASTAVNQKSLMVEGNSASGRMADVIPSTGIPVFAERTALNGNDNDLRPFLESLHSETTENSGIFADLWSQQFVDIGNKTRSLRKSLSSTNTITPFAGGDFGPKLKMIAEFIMARNERGNGVNRDVFFVEMGGFDSHSNVAQVLGARLPGLNTAIESFWAEIKAQGIENQVVVVQGSEFGRTITPNSNQGSDHAWGGNYFLFGGDVSGGKILGKYPDTFGPSDINIGRGRLIPTTSWDSLWYGIAQWFGITDPASLNEVLPNSRNFGCDLFTDTDIFLSGSNQAIRGCGGASLVSTFEFNYGADPRHLIGKEQKEICNVAVEVSMKRLKIEEVDVRCYVDNQRITKEIDIMGEELYMLQADAVLNYDSSVQRVNQGVVNNIARTASATASQFIVTDANVLTAEPTMTPTTDAPTTTPPTAAPTTKPPTAAPTTKPPTENNSSYYYYENNASSLSPSSLSPIFLRTDCGTMAHEQVDYRGTEATTASGIICQHWDADTPHTHTRTADIYPNAGLEENYCRNPDGEPKAWCYTTDPGTRWETCGVPACEDVDAAANNTRQLRGN